MNRLTTESLWENWVNGNRMDVVNYLLERLADEPKKAVLEISNFQSRLTLTEQTAFRLLWRQVAL